ncbi:hypothetical protein MKUB_54090 [Mycobacterium kubicae]|uniref:Uncharacterized protein n=1 Tax=Mycobacterium kubicae TaxID=120959 RepID=A0ABQ1BW24_9MYCO|nr:hypothetical protein MKUB_54090 [Mycobacterium kubicae]
MRNPCHVQDIRVFKLKQGAPFTNLFERRRQVQTIPQFVDSHQEQSPGRIAGQKPEKASHRAHPEVATYRYHLMLGRNMQSPQREDID